MSRNGDDGPVPQLLAPPWYEAESRPRARYETSQYDLYPPMLSNAAEYDYRNDVQRGIIAARERAEEGRQVARSGNPGGALRYMIASLVGLTEVSLMLAYQAHPENAALRNAFQSLRVAIAVATTQVDAADAADE
jgi:hypothetical protein